MSQEKVEPGQVMNGEEEEVGEEEEEYEGEGEGEELETIENEEEEDNENCPDFGDILCMTIEEVERYKKKIAEDDRMDSIYRMKQNLADKFDNRAFLHPHGMTEFDYKSIPTHKKLEFDKFKHRTRHDNYRYLGEHYELDAMLSLFVRKVLVDRPIDTVHYAAEYFTRDILAPGYQLEVASEMRKLSNYRVMKMKEAEKITTIPIHELGYEEEKPVPKIRRCFPKEGTPEPCPEKVGPPRGTPEEEAAKRRQNNLNDLKKLNIGPLAQHDDMPPGQKEKVKKFKPKKEKPKKHVYCGCKDPGRREKAHPVKDTNNNPTDTKKSSLKTSK